MTTTKKRIALALLVLLLLVTILTVNMPISYAQSNNVTYSTVLDDLKKDSNFDKKYYPVAEKDYSLQIIQIAESVNKELFVYVYQPSGQAKQLKASSINISNTVKEDISFRNYKLQLLNSDGVFYKYVVKDFTVLPDPTRYYAISSIYRPFDDTIDNGADHGNTITEVNYNVSKQYCFSVINGQPYCSVVDLETIIITDKFVGFVRYSNGFEFYPSACDSHFVAFNTDKPIDKLLEADVYYTTQEHTKHVLPYLGTKEKFGEKVDKYAYLKYSDKVEHTGDGWFAGTYKWDRIETVDQFISENNLTQNVYTGAIIDIKVANRITDEGKAALKGKKWVLRFAETSYLNINNADGGSGYYTTMVGDVTILRLKFEFDGVVYNLGTIDNKQSGSDIPINDEDLIPELSKSFKWVLAVICLIILIVLLSPILPYILRLIIWVITLPFKLFSAIFNWIKKGTNKKG